MNKRFLGVLLAVAAFTAASVAQATVHRVYPGESIQAAIDAAMPGDTILVEPGVYKEKNNDVYGLRINKDNLRLIGMVRKKKGQGRVNKVRLLAHKGVFLIAPVTVVILGSMITGSTFISQKEEAGVS